MWRYASLTLSIEVPRKLKPLLAPKRYKGAYGGRGGAKSHFFAEQVILKCYVTTSRIVCIREVQNSIKDSVRQLLIDKIHKLGLADHFQVLDTEIRGANGSFIVFKGMQSYNAANIKSLEAFDIAWVEEAQTLSQHSLDLLRPTLRKEGSELWFSWNPRYKTDPVDKFFRKSPPPDAISVSINWMDNPWFPDVLRKELDHDFWIDPDKAEHIWNGAYGAGMGAILAKYVNQAERQQRIRDDVEYDHDGGALELSCDLGFRDTTGWWYWQRKLGGYSLLKYEGESGWDASDWIQRIKYVLEEELKIPRLGKIWLPHDARAKTFQSKHSSVEQFVEAFGADKVAIVPMTRKEHQINAARTVIQRCEFNKTLCENGLDGLMAWEFEWSEENNVFSREPLHNWASHPADAFAYGCQMMQEQEPATAPADGTIRGITVGDNKVTLNELWATVQKASGRI
jgi:phage terminase large subunit